MKVALIHDWLTGMRGGEYVLEAIAELFTDPDLFTLVSVPENISKELRSIKTTASWLNKIPGIKKIYRALLPLMPNVIERFDLTEYDLIVSSSHCVAKGVVKAKSAVHVSYVHAPMRYMWNRFDDYFGPGRASWPVRLGARMMRPYLKAWDRRISQPDRVDSIIANSQYIANQILENYGRKAKVINPFVDLARFRTPRVDRQKYLMVTAFAPYKRVDLAIHAFNQLKLPLQIVGSGQEKKVLQRLAGPSIEFLGSLTNDQIDKLYAECRAFIFPGEEDFGISPLEAMAAGAPVIAYGAGGATETVTAATGLLFSPQTPEALQEAVLRLERGEVTFQEKDGRARAADFSKANFKAAMRETIKEAWGGAGKPWDELKKSLTS